MGWAGRRVIVLFASAAIVGSILVVAPSEAFGTEGPQDVVVDDFPISNQPRVMDGRVYAIDSFGDWVVVGGTFTTIRNAATGSPEISQPYLFKFNVSTGQIDEGFAPVLNGEVEGVAISADGSSVFIGGDFVTVNGGTRQRIAKISLADGSLDTTFVANANNEVKDIALTQDMLIVGGRFRFVNGVNRERLAGVNPTTGAVLSSLNIPVTEPRAFAPYIQELDVSDNESWLLIGGNFKQVGGNNREQVAVIDLTTNPAIVANWGTDRYVPNCASVYADTYIRGLEIAPSNDFFVIGATGAYRGSSVLCDTATRWELPPVGVGEGQQPTWVNHTGGDTLWATEITEAAVYVGGHQRWQNNPFPSPGGDNDGPGSVKRPGIAALDPLTGVPLSWNPGRDRGRGVEAFHATEDYLYVGSDTVLFAGVVRQRLAVLPVAGGFPNPDPEQIVLPVDLHIGLNGGDLGRLTYDGSTFGPMSVVSGPGIDGINWSSVRDGFVQHGDLVYFGSAQAYFRRPYDGSGFGTPTNLSTSVGYVDSNASLTPYDQPYGVAEVTDAGYSWGRLYYTRSDDNRLWWRHYAIESGIIGGFQFVASHADWSGAVAIDVVGDWVYAAWDDGNLYRMPISNGNVDFNARQVADDGSASGVNWATVESMFSTQGSGTGNPPPPPPPLTCDEPTPWLASYYANMNLQGAPATERCEAVLDYDWGTGSPPGTGVGPDNFSARWTRSIELAEEKSLEVTAISDDGVRVYTDGALLINEWRDQAPTTFTELSEPLSAGTHEIVVEYYENGGGARIGVSWVEQEPPPPPPGPDETDPDTSVSVPSNGQQFGVSNPTVVGSATDNVGVTVVEVAVRDTVNKLWLQPNGSFASGYATMPASLDNAGGTSTGWSFPVDLANGSYAVQPRAFDSAGNRDQSPPWVPFSINATTPSPSVEAVLIGAGDISRCDLDSDEDTATIIDGYPGATVFTTGDNVYPDGTAQQYSDCYDPTWGRHKSRTKPTPGNHDYHVVGAADYFTYFGSAAATAGEGWYSYDLGSWHFLALNSNCSEVGGCGPTSPQGQWLASDLAANTGSSCTLAYMHHPRFSSGSHGSSIALEPMWDILYQYGVDVVVAGHDHVYERFSLQAPDGSSDPTNGIRQFTVGTGGSELTALGSSAPNSEVGIDDAHGVLKLDLSNGSYAWEFVSVAGSTASDSGSDACVDPSS